MNTQKYRIGNCGLLREADRSMYKNKDTVSKSCIHKERTHLNYNLCPHEQYTAAQVREINKKIRGKELAKNAIAWGGTAITQPKDYTGSTEDFMRTAYEGLKKIYGLTDDDVISAYVHLDEDAEPHMHFYFIPIAHEQKKDCVNWNKVLPKWKYDQQHQILQKYMTDKLQTPVNLINGETLGFDVQKLTAEEKRLSMRVKQLKKSVSNLRKREIDVQKSVDAIETAKDRLLAEINSMVKAHDGLRRVLNRPWVSARDEIEVAKDKAETRTEKALEQPLDDVDAILSAALAAERATRVYNKLKSVAKGEVDASALRKDDDFELC